MPKKITMTVGEFIGRLASFDSTLPVVGEGISDRLTGPPEIEILDVIRVEPPWGGWDYDPQAAPGSHPPEAAPVPMKVVCLRFPW